MASLAKRLDDNAPGEFYVDRTCIDCGTCRRIAPSSFAEAHDHSFVARQPGNDDETARARMALVACPVGAIGAVSKQDLDAARRAFPEAIDGEVYDCGWACAESYGAASYFIRRPAGNVLVDSPRFAAPLVARLEAMGGVRWMFLTHRDDIGDHARFQAHFGCERVAHARDLGGRLAYVERAIDGDAPIGLARDLLLIPTPGHSPGSTCLLYRNRFLFAGDHLAWHADRQSLYAFRRYCWHDWNEQITSVRRLAGYQFEWLLPGHGRRVRLDRPAMRHAVEACARWMESVA